MAWLICSVVKERFAFGMAVMKLSSEPVTFVTSSFPSFSWKAVLLGGSVSLRLPDHRLVLRSRLTAFCEDELLGFITKSLVDDSGEVAEAGGDSGFWIPRVDEGSSLAFADQCAGTLEAIELALDGIERNFKIPRNGSAVGFSMMK